MGKHSEEAGYPVGTRGSDSRMSPKGWESDRSAKPAETPSERAAEARHEGWSITGRNK